MDRGLDRPEPAGEEQRGHVRRGTHVETPVRAGELDPVPDAQVAVDPRGRETTDEPHVDLDVVHLRRAVRGGKRRCPPAGQVHVDVLAGLERQAGRVLD